MRSWLSAPLIAILLLAGRATAQPPCAHLPALQGDEDVVTRIDRYRAEPRHPATYRALAGLGDPGRETDGANLWELPEEERELIAQMLPGISRPDLAYYGQTGTCRLDHALQLARQRIARLGREHPYVGQWLRAQRAVFAACRDEAPWAARDEGVPIPKGTGVPLPPAMATDDPVIRQLQRDDRAYQSASILFYRRDPAAAAAFRRLAGGGSPHAAISRYMLVAIEARDLDDYHYDEAPEEAARRIARARAALAGAQAILDDPRLAEIHPLTQGLIGFLGYWTGDDSVREAQVDSLLDALTVPLPRILADPVARDRYERAVHDIEWLRRDMPGEGWLESDVVARSSAARALTARARRDPAAAWLIAGVSAWERDPWARHPQSIAGFPLREMVGHRAGQDGGRAWTVLNASLAASYQPDAWDDIDALIAETRACPTDDRLAAVANLFYHQVRGALMYPVLDEDYLPLETQPGFAVALAHVEAWPWRQGVHYRELVSDMLHYLVAEGRIEEARTLRDRVDLRGEDQRENAAALLLLAEDEDHFAREVAAMPDSGQVLINQLSVQALARLAGRADLPAAVRARFARVAWSRLYALERPVPARLDRLMRSLNPEIAAGWTSRPGARPGSPALLLDVLRSPALNIVIADHQRAGAQGNSGYADDPGLTAIDTYEHSDNNWWCAWQPDRHGLTAGAALYAALFAPADEWDSMAAAGATAALGPLLRASWLWQARDEAEQSALAAIPSAPRLLAERAIAWPGRRRGQDEALALAVRATRYGCQRQGGHGAWSRAAFTLLHARFPDSEAARRTRYWFDCSHFTGGCAGQRFYVPAWQRWAGRPWNY